MDRLQSSTAIMLRPLAISHGGIKWLNLDDCVENTWARKWFICVYSMCATYQAYLCSYTSVL